MTGLEIMLRHVLEKGDDVVWREQSVQIWPRGFFNSIQSKCDSNISGSTGFSERGGPGRCACWWGFRTKSVFLWCLERSIKQSVMWQRCFPAQGAQFHSGHSTSRANGTYKSRYRNKYLTRGFHKYLRDLGLTQIVRSKVMATITLC